MGLTASAECPQWVESGHLIAYYLKEGHVRKLPLVGMVVLALAVAANCAIALSGYEVLTSKNVTNGWIVEGDLLFPQWVPELADYKDKMPIQFTDCVYWNGFVIKHYPLPSTMWPAGCPLLVFPPD